MRFLKMLLVSIGLVALGLSGCGGGGGGLPAEYTGTTTQAVVTTTNAKSLSSSAYNVSQAANSLAALGKAVSDSNNTTSSLQLEVASILENSLSEITPTLKSTSKVVDQAVSAQNTISGYSGTYSYSINLETTNGATNGSLSFVQYKPSSTSAIINGTISFSGTYNQTSGSFSSFNMTLSRMSATSSSVNVNLSGNLAMSTNGTTKTMTMTLAATDSVNNRTFLIKDYSWQLTGNSLTVSGVYYDPTYGYVIVSTATPLTVSAYYSTPSAGRLLFSGSNGSKARMTFSSNSYTVEADSAGNGTFVVVP